MMPVLKEFNITSPTLPSGTLRRVMTEYLVAIPVFMLKENTQAI